MTEAQKILNLLKSNDPKSCLLGFQLMESLHLRPVIAELICQNSAFELFDTIPDHFFYYQNVIDPHTLGYLTSSIDTLLVKSNISDRLKAKIALTVQDFIPIIKPKASYETYSKMVCEGNDMNFNLGLSWIVDQAQHTYLNKKFEEITEALQDKQSFKEYYKSNLSGRLCGGKPLPPTEGEKFIQVASRLRRSKFQYQWNPLQETAFEFSILIKFDENSVKRRKKNTRSASEQ
ncbi:MAG TPA: hypothetical protein DCS93_21285 [Microscillaceae bacterium]|nr:hypothetical protein [Microscillaceae bacterium]